MEVTSPTKTFRHIYIIAAGINQGILENVATSIQQHFSLLEETGDLRLPTVGIPAHRQPSFGLTLSPVRLPGAMVAGNRVAVTRHADDKSRTHAVDEFLNIEKYSPDLSLLTTTDGGKVLNPENNSSQTPVLKAIKEDDILSIEKKASDFLRVEKIKGRKTARPPKNILTIEKLDIKLHDRDIDDILGARTLRTRDIRVTSNYSNNGISAGAEKEQNDGSLLQEKSKKTPNGSSSRKKTNKIASPQTGKPPPSSMPIEKEQPQTMEHTLVDLWFGAIGSHNRPKTQRQLEEEYIDPARVLLQETGLDSKSLLDLLKTERESLLVKGFYNARKLSTIGPMVMNRLKVEAEVKIFEKVRPIQANPYSGFGYDQDAPDSL